MLVMKVWSTEATASLPDANSAESLLIPIRMMS